MKPKQDRARALRAELDAYSDEQLGQLLRRIWLARPDEAIGRYARTYIADLSDAELLKYAERHVRTEFSTQRPRAKA